MVNGLEREREREDGVGGHQVDEEYICDRVELLELVEDEQNRSVAQYAGDEDDVVEGWKKMFAEVADFDGVALNGCAGHQRVVFIKVWRCVGRFHLTCRVERVYYN